MASNPKWWQLYALFLVPVFLLVLERQLPLSAGDHEAAQIAIILLAYGLIYLWLSANTAAFAESDKEQDRQRVAERFYPSGLLAESSADGSKNEEESMASIAGDNGPSPVEASEISGLDPKSVETLRVSPKTLEALLPVVKMTDVRYDG